MLFALLLGGFLLYSNFFAKMRINKTETAAFFQKSGVAYMDAVIQVGAHPVHYIETGNPANPTLVFIHGSPGAWDGYKDYLVDSLLLSKYRMIAVDRPGFGYSDFGKTENLMQQADILTQFVAQKTNGQNVTLIGHSYGGPLVVKMGVDQPQAYSTIMVLAGSVDPAAETPEKWRPFLIAFPFRYLVPGALRPSNQELWWLKEDLKQLEPLLPNLTANLVIIHGTKDRLVPYSNAAYIIQRCIHAQSSDLITLENVDHFIPWTHFSTVRDRLML